VPIPISSEIKDRKEIILEKELELKPNFYNIIPYKDRVENYRKIRESIFNTKNVRVVKNKRSKKRMKKFWEKVRKERRKLIQTVSARSNKKQDIRPYAEVLIKDERLYGLLDSGAEVSNEKELKSIASKRKTADGRNQTVLGHIELKVTYQDKPEFIDFYLIPKLQQEVVLGVDFWQKFGIVPDVIKTMGSKEICNVETEKADLLYSAQQTSL